MEELLNELEVACARRDRLEKYLKKMESQGYKESEGYRKFLHIYHVANGQAKFVANKLEKLIGIEWNLEEAE